MSSACVYFRGAALILSIDRVAIDRHNGRTLVTLSRLASLLMLSIRWSMCLKRKERVKLGMQYIPQIGGKAVDDFSVSHRPSLNGI